MVEDITRRTKTLIHELEMTERAFAERLKIPQTTLNSSLKSAKGISLSVISLILDTFNDVSSEWLMRGEGEMFGRKNGRSVTTTIYSADHSSTAGEHINSNDAAILAMQKQIEEQNAQIRKLTDALVNITTK